MADPRVERLAQLLARYSVPVEEGHKVEISGNDTGRALAA